MHVLPSTRVDQPDPLHITAHKVTISLRPRVLYTANHASEPMPCPSRWRRSAPAPTPSLLAGLEKRGLSLTHFLR